MTTPSWVGEFDEPADILDGAISAQKKLLSGFGGNPNADKKKLKEAQEPKHCAISLAGEPTFYPGINELIEECGRRGMTSFLVTNGTHQKFWNVSPNPHSFISPLSPQTPKLTRLSADQQSPTAGSD